MSKLKFFFSNFEEILCSLALSITILAVLINTILGWTVGRRFGEFEEIALVGFVWITFLGISVVYKDVIHIRIDFILDALPKKITVIIDFVINIGIILFCFFVTKNASMLMFGAINKTTSLLRMSYFFIDLPVVLGFGLMSIRMTARLFGNLRTDFKGGDA